MISGSKDQIVSYNEIKQYTKTFSFENAGLNNKCLIKHSRLNSMKQITMVSKRFIRWIIGKMLSQVVIIVWASVNLQKCNADQKNLNVFCISFVNVSLKYKKCMICDTV